MDPHTSRWQSADPAGFDLANPMGEDGEPRQGYSIVEGMNWYAYCSNNPVKYVDPDGMDDAATMTLFGTAAITVVEMVGATVVAIATVATFFALLFTSDVVQTPEQVENLANQANSEDGETETDGDSDDSASSEDSEPPKDNNSKENQKRVSSKTLRKRWEETTGREWQKILRQVETKMFLIKIL